MHISRDTVGADIVLPIRKVSVKGGSGGGETVMVGVFIRPHLISTLKDLAKKYELIMMSSSGKEVTNKIVDYLEKDGQIFSFRLSRESCYLTDLQLFVKDLRVINRPLDSMLLVDDCTYSFGFQLDNGVPIIPFTGSKEDAELLLLGPYLDWCMQAVDVRQPNRSQFKFHLYRECSSVDEVLKKLFPK